MPVRFPGFGGGGGGTATPIPSGQVQVVPHPSTGMLTVQVGSNQGSGLLFEKLTIQHGRCEQSGGNPLITQTTEMFNWKIIPVQDQRSPVFNLPQVPPAQQEAGSGQTHYFIDAPAGYIIRKVYFADLGAPVDDSASWNRVGQSQRWIKAASGLSILAAAAIEIQTV